MKFASQNYAHLFPPHFAIINPKEKPAVTNPNEQPG
jgi:hypothetical protein